jgi:hypothetical protein
MSPSGSISKEEVDMTATITQETGQLIERFLFLEAHGG